jgi:hypothetical protein
MKSHKDIAAQFKEHKSRASLLGTQYDNTRKCQAFYSGDFMDYRDTFVARGMDGQKRTTEVSFNKVKPYVNAAHGFMLHGRWKRHTPTRRTIMCGTTRMRTSTMRGRLKTC